MFVRVCVLGHHKVVFQTGCAAMMIAQFTTTKTHRSLWSCQCLWSIFM